MSGRRSSRSPRFFPGKVPGASMNQECEAVAQASNATRHIRYVWAEAVFGCVWCFLALACVVKAHARRTIRHSFGAHGTSRLASHRFFMG